MHKGSDFLLAQVSNNVMQHKTLLESLEDHEKQAQDSRFRELCTKYIPQLRQHQTMIEEYRTSLGEPSGEGFKNALGFVLGKAKDAVDAVRNDDFLRLVEDIVMIRQAQDTFATFAAVGDRIGQPRLAEIGRAGAKQHDEMQREFNALVHDFFVKNAQAE